MGLEELKNEIIEEAEKRAKQIIEDGKKEADSITAKAKEQIKGYKAKLREDENNLILNLEKMKIAQTRSEIKKQLLDKKKSVIDSVFEEAIKKIKNFPDKKRRQYLENLLEKAKKELDIARIYCSKKDSKFLKDIECVPEDITGGLIAENKESTMRIDYSFDTILENIKENSLQEVAKILFKDD